MKDENVYFRPRARLMLELGEQLIKNESVAMLELIKNSYDAFARNVNVRLDNIDDCDAGLIVIEDDGIGMTKETVVNHWMEPATFNKKKIVDNCKEAITHNGVKRIPLGEKGIGRFGAHKLGNHIKLVTRNEDDQTNREVYFEINWNDFNNDKYLNEVEVKVFEREPEVFVGDKHGTRIEITELRHNWQKREYRNVYKSMLSLNSPFKTDDSFKIHIKSTHEELASVESTDEIDNVKATKNILSVIADLVKDRYLDLTSNNNRISELAEYMDVLPTFDPNNVSIEVKARLNTAFNINTHGSENEKLPGKVYKTNQIDDLDSFDKSTFGKKGKQLVLTKKDKKVVVVYDLIKVDITPGCDYAQDKAFISTYAYGYLIHIYKFEDEKGNKEWLEWKYAGMISDAGGVYFTPYFLNGDELCMLLVNTKWIRFEKYEVNEDNYLFRLNDSLTSDIRKSASDNIARVGIPCV